jgi:hypothetical protein
MLVKPSATGPRKAPGVFEADEVEVTLDMISAGMEAYASFDPEREDPEALVFAIIFRALEIERRNQKLRSSVARTG